MSNKHFDNKNNLIAEMRRTKRQSEYAIAATFTAYMNMALITLHKELEMEQNDLLRFSDGVYRRIEEYDSGKLTVEQMKKYLVDEVGMIVEGPKIEY